MVVPAARVAALALYPVKSCAGVPLARADVLTTGLGAHGTRDRAWMIVDASGRFVTQRECPALALVHAQPHPAGIALGDAAGARIEVEAPAGSARDVVVWRDAVGGIDAGDAVAAWLSARAGREVRLVAFDPARRRPCNSAFAGDSGAHTLFADGYPLLVIAQASLDALNERLAAKGAGPVGMRRFRPSLVLDGLEAHDEDHVATIETDSVTLRLVKPCTRCQIPSIDPDTGETGDEPLATLSTYRNDPARGITFGMNAIVLREGPIAVGDAVRVRFAF